MASTAGDTSASAATACLHVAIGDWQEFLEEARRALAVLEKLDQEPDEPEKRSDSGIGASSTAPTPDDLTVENVKLDDESKEKKKKKKKTKKAKKAGEKGGDDESEDEDSSEVTSTVQSTVSGSDLTANSVLTSAMSGDSDSIRLAEADKLAAQGTAQARAGDPESLRRAIQLLTSAISLYPNRVGYYGNRSLCFYKSEDYTSSLNDAVKALELEPDNLKYLNRKAQALIALKRQTDARAVVEEMLRLSPNNESALALLDDIRRQLIDDNSAGAQSRREEDDDDTISCAASSIQPPVRPVTIKVSNLPADISQPALKSLFTKENITVTSVAVSGQGSASVSVVNSEAARRAVSKLDGISYENKVIKVELQK